MTAKKNAIRIVGFCCRHALQGEKQLAEDRWMTYEPTIKIVQIPCSSKIDTLPIVKAFEAGADGIFVLACPDTHCHLLDGNIRAKKVISYTRELLEAVGIEGDRLKMFQLGGPEWPSFQHVADSMKKDIDALGKAS